MHGLAPVRTNETIAATTPPPATTTSPTAPTTTTAGQLAASLTVPARAHCSELSTHLSPGQHLSPGRIT